MKFVIALICSLVITGLSFAGNPTQYQSLHGDLGRAVSDGTGYCQLPGIIVKGYLPYFRVFVPPGTRIVSLSIYEYGKQTAIARHKIIPITREIPNDYFAPQSRSLVQLMSSDQIISENREAKITLIQEGIPYPYVTLGNAGWLYVYVTGGGSSNTYNHSYILGVDEKIYNAWRDSVNWENNVEGVEVYGSSTPVPTPVPTPNPTPTPTPVPTPTPTPIPGVCGPSLIYLGDFGTYRWNGTGWVR